MKIKNLTKEDFFKKLAPAIAKRGLEVEDRSDHRHHIQFTVRGSSGECMVQIYESKKGTHARVINDVGGCENEVNAAVDEILGRLPLAPAAREDTPATDAARGTIGTDESGKGDFFGPLVVAAAYVPAGKEADLLVMGVRDSKLLSDSAASRIAAYLRREVKHSIVTIGPPKYNELYEKMRNVNKILGWCHARVIENILEEVDCAYAVTDQFGSKSYVEKALMEKGRSIRLDQRPRAEEITAVAAASILARDEFLRRLDALSRDFGLALPKGASSMVDDAARLFVKKHGRAALAEVAKVHFKNATRL